MRRMEGKINRRLAVKLLGGAVTVLATGSAYAQVQYPPSMMTVIHGYSPGGLSDVTCRRLADALEREWGSSVIVENRPGANANIAASAVANGPPDGTLMLVSAYETLMITSAAGLNVGFDPMNDLAPVALIGEIENWFLASPDAPFDSVPEFLEYAAANPGLVSWGSNGVGSSGHLAMEQINAQTQAGLVHIPYQGAAMLTDLMAGNVDVVLSSRSSTATHVQDGRLKVLATTGRERSSFSSDLPTFAEVGLEDIVVPYALAAFVPATTDEATIERLNRDIRKVLHASEVREQLEASGLPVGDLSPDQLRERMQSEHAVLRDIIESNNILLQ